MRIRYDAEVDALSISFSETTVTTQDLAEGIVDEYDAQGQLVGLEILDAGRRVGDAGTLQQVVLEGLAPVLPGGQTSFSTTTPPPKP